MTTATTIKVQLQIRQDTAANWSAINPTLLAGELGRESDTGKIKIGNGSSTWGVLSYQPFGGDDLDLPGTLDVTGITTLDDALRFNDADNSNWVSFQAPTTVSSNVTWTLPDADAAVSGYALVSNGAGVLSWSQAGGAVIVDGGNFANGSSIVTTSSTIDGGSFT